MINLQTLIDKASEKCGNDANLARKMGVRQTVISDMRHRGRTITPETAAELAAIAGEDVIQAMVDAVIERNKGTRRGSVLKEILGKGVAAGVAGMLLFSYSGDSIYAMENPKTKAHKSVTAFNKLRIASLLRLFKRLTRWTGNRLGSKAHHQGLHPRYPVGFASP